MGAVKLDYLPVPKRSYEGTMPFNPSQGMCKEESKLRRAVKALPFLAITATAVYFMWGVRDCDILAAIHTDTNKVSLPPMLAQIGATMKNGVDSQIGEPGHLKTFDTFYGLDFMDSRIRGLAACFTSFQLVDVVSSWQSLTFLTDIGLVYSIMLIEGARRANIGTVAWL